MRQLITKTDIRSLVGKFIIQLNSDNENVNITHGTSAGFWMEKRIAFVGILDLLGEHILDTEDRKEKRAAKEPYVILNGLYYCQGAYTHDEFVDKFNGANGDRFYRLLTSKELDWLNEQQKDRNY